MAIETLGPYRIKRIIGRGGMGTVYAAVNQESDEKAAIKVLSSTLANDDAFRERFEAEIEALKTLKHPNIVQLYGYGEQDGALFYAMELVEGNNLEEDIQDGKRFEWAETTRIAIDVCRALKHAHDTGVIHRDLKPANLMIDPDGNIKLTDFGIAKLFGHTPMTAAGGVIGTADYMSPEQAEGRPATPRSDLYSLGSVMYALLSGRPPFRGKSLTDVLHQLRYNEAVPVTNYAPETPRQLSGVIDQLLSKESQRRIPTALALSNVLQATEHALAAATDPVIRKVEENGSDEFISSEDGSPVGPVTGYSSFAVTRPMRDEPEPPDSPPTIAAETNEPPTPSSPTSARDGAATQLFEAPPKQEESETTDSTDSTQAHFTAVDPEQLGRNDRLMTPDDDAIPGWIKAVGTVLVLLVIAPIAYRLSQPPSANELYERITAIASVDDAARLFEAEPDIRAFLERFPDDPHASELKAMLAEIELDRMERRFKHRANRLRSEVATSPIEQAYSEVVPLLESDPEQAESRLRALLDVFGNQEDLSRREELCLTLARRQLPRLRASIDRASQQHLETIQQRLAQADELLATDPPAAAAIWRGVVELYADKDWAAGVVGQARASLAESSE